MPARLPPGLDRSALSRLIRGYRARWRVPVALCDPAGRLLQSVRIPGPDEPAATRLRRLALEESLRWGQVALTSSPDGRWFLWALPLMHNSRVCAGLVAWIAESQALDAQGRFRIDLTAAATDLRRRAEQLNLTNAAFLELRRREYEFQRQRAQAIHEFKQNPAFHLRTAYLVNEPELLAAIRRGDRPRAREILNQQLTAMLYQAGDRLELAKTFFMELVVTMCRSAVEAGADPAELLGARYDSLTRLAATDDPEALARWLSDMLEHIMNAIAARPAAPAQSLVAQALAYIRENCRRNLTRTDVARAVHCSPSYLSRLFRRHLNTTFRHLLNQQRINLAAELLVRTNLSIKAVALETGFQDQSYLTKVFRRHMGTTPQAYRRLHASASSAAGSTRAS